MFDDESDEADAVDIEPAPGLLEEAGPLSALIRQAAQLIQQRDPKLDALIKILKPLIEAGADPVVFCRFIATAEHVATGLRKAFPKLRIEAVTGAATAEERRERVESMGGSEQRLLVATDCLSEGINLQDLFDAVVHYDLSWNPTRHQQREGRVDRFGQRKPEVRSVLLYSPDSAIDGAVLDVILRKADAIRKKTGVTVPLPEERAAITGALMNAVLLRRRPGRQLTLNLEFAEDTRQIEVRWRDAEEGERRSRARFAQNAIKPEEVAPEWRRWRELIGGPDQVHDFVERAMARLDAPMERLERGASKAPLGALPPFVRERLAARGLEGTVRVAFEEPPPPGAEMVQRTHALPSTLAEAIAEAALDPAALPNLALGRTGAWLSDEVTILTTVALLRLRYKLTVKGRRDRLLLVEETGAVALDAGGAVALSGEAARGLLDARSRGDLAPAARERLLTQARERLEIALQGALPRFAGERSSQLASDHARIRQAGIAVSAVEVEPVLPPDVIGFFVLVPGGA